MQQKRWYKMNKEQVPLGVLGDGHLPGIPTGLAALCSMCEGVYPNQRNPLQVSAVLKYWLGGPDPLDYVSMYANDGNPELNVPPHWHYISFGLSDLHGDGRVHKVSGPGFPSGFGFELTFRLERKHENDSGKPPTWPASLMQSLAKYVFNSGNTFCAGDHISWHCGLDGSNTTKIKHMLVANDPQLNVIDTPCGTVNFFQIVGVCEDELQAAQRWNGHDLLNMLKRAPGIGNHWMVTDINRKMSLFELDHTVSNCIEAGITEKGSNLTGVSCHCYWSDHFISGAKFTTSNDSKIFSRAIASEFYNTCMQNIQRSSYQSINFDVSHSDGLTPLPYLHIMLNKEAGFLLPLVVRGRLNHGRHFTFKNVLGNVTITFVAWSVTGAGVFVDEDMPFVVCGPWLQIYIAEDFMSVLEEDFRVFNNTSNVQLPKTFNWIHKNFAITVVPDEN